MEARPTLLKRILGDPRNALKKNLGNLRNAFKKILGKLRNAWGGLIVLLANWLVFIAALLALVFGVWLLVLVSHGTPVAAAFTRVGGPTRVETAVAASRFWLTPPSQFVTIPADAEEKIILRAAQYAMTHDAPLLFTSRTPRRQWLVRMTIHNWRDDAKARHLPRPARVNAQDLPNGKVCPANPAAADSLANRLAGNRLDQTLRHEFAVEMNGGVLDWLITGPTGPVPNIQSLVVKPNYRLSTLAASNRLLPCRLPVPDQNRLAPVVVFAVPKGPHDSPDVAVGLALAAHLAFAAPTAMTEPDVSLVVVPRYLQSDPQLEAQLRDQHVLVQGGVVLGSNRILSDDLDALLRQILTSTDQQGVLGQIQSNLGLVAPLIAALLTLLGLGAAAVVAPGIRQKAIAYGKEEKKYRPGTETVMPTAKNEWLNALGDAQNDRRRMTVWLRTGQIVTGVVDRQHSTAAVLRLNEARRLEPTPEFKADFWLVPFEGIESIGGNVQNPADE